MKKIIIIILILFTAPVLSAAGVFIFLSWKANIARNNEAIKSENISFNRNTENSIIKEIEKNKKANCESCGQQSSLDLPGSVFSNLKTESPETGSLENSAEVRPAQDYNEEIKAIYLTGWSAGNKNMIDYAVGLAKKTEINAFVIDIKDYSGFVGYNSNVEQVIEYRAIQIKIPDIRALIEKLHKENIYVIGRISVFQDSIFALRRPESAVQSRELLENSTSSLSSLWSDEKGLYWVDPASKEAWDYNIAIAKEAIEIGFDEINFDYVRFPSDGILKDMVFPVWENKEKEAEKHIIIKDFFAYLRQELSQARLSVDLFGLSTIRYDDLGIGQVIEDAFDYFDYICPMVYPSHYASGFIGYQNPAEYPYQVIKYSLDNALIRLKNSGSEAKLRPWFQDFDLGADYDAEMVRAEIQAVEDALSNDSVSDYAGFMLWSPYNIYTEEALKQE